MNEACEMERGAASTASSSDEDRFKLLERAYHDFLRGREAGTEGDPDAYCARFPGLKSSLGRLLQLHCQLEKHPHLLSEEIPAAWLRAGETYLGFSLVRELGRGAFSRVFLAKEPMLGNRLVVVKISNHKSAEAAILGRIDHPHIVPVHSIQTDERAGLTVVCMPYLGTATLHNVLDKLSDLSEFPARGQVILDVAAATSCAEDSTSRATLAAIVRNGTYVDAVRHIGAQLADALAFIHQRGICHRDLKPSNVLLTLAGKAMLLDFNLSATFKQANATPGGTVPYLAPELLPGILRQEDGHPALVSARSDMYSLGVILYELLTCAHPFGPLPLKLSAEEHCEHLMERQPGGPRPLRQLRPEVDKPLARLIEQCLAYDPKERPQSAAELAAALRKGLKPLPRTRRWVRRYPGRTSVAIALGLAAFAIVTVLWFSRPPYSERQFQHGLALYGQGQYRQAVQRFNEALEADPGLVEALFARGRSFQQLGLTENRYFSVAVADYQEAEKRAPNGRTEACLAYCLNRLGNHRPAIASNNLAVAAGFASAEVFNNLGCAYFQLKELEEAQKHLDQAVRLKPELQAPFYTRALLWREKALCCSSPPGQGALAIREQGTKADAIAKGISDIRRAIALGPGSAMLYRDASHLCVLAADGDRKWVTPALDYMTLAIEHGDDPRRLKTVYFALLRNEPRFKALADRPPPAVPPGKAQLFLDPIDDTPK